jgi:hypothetical protein
MVKTRMEPFRGFVEKKLRSICRGKEFKDEFSQDIKAKLLEVLYEEVETRGRKQPPPKPKNKPNFTPAHLAPAAPGSF